MKSLFSAPRFVVLFAGVVALAGCAAPRDAVWPEPRPLGADLSTYRPPSASATRPPHETPPAVASLTLAEALARTLRLNPDLEAFAWEVRALEARALQAGLWPNPDLEAEAESFGGTDARSGFSDAEYGLSLGQLLPLGGDVGARRRVARRELGLAGWDYEAARLDVLTSTTQAFVAVLAAQERALVADSLHALAGRFAQTVAARAEAGKVSPLEASRAEVVRARAGIAAEEARRMLTAARVRLSSFWGQPEARFTRAVGEMADVTPVPPYEAVAALTERNPDVARWAEVMALRRAELDLTRAERIPDPVLRAGPTRYPDTGEVAFRAGIAIPLPLFDRGQGAVREARARIRRSEAEAEAAALAARRALAGTYETLAAAHGAVTTLQREVLPVAQATLEATEEGYREGKFDLLSVLDAQRTLFEATTQYLDAAETYHRARAEVERLVGTPLTTIRAGAAPDNQ